MNEELRQQIHKAIRDVRGLRKTEEVVVACNIKDFEQVQETIEDPRVQVIAATYVEKCHVRVEAKKDYWVKKAVRDWEEKNAKNANKKDSDRLGIRSDYIRIHPRSVTDPGSAGGNPISGTRTDSGL